MKRILILLLACLTIFGAVSCQPRTIFVPYPGGNSDKTETSVVATDFDSMKEAMESETVKNVTLAGFSFNPADVSAQLPIAVNGEKTISGSMYAGDQTSTASLIRKAATTSVALNENGYTIFEISNDATVNLVNLTISIADDIANAIRSIFSINTGSLNADTVTVNTSDTVTSAPVLIETTANTTADKVNITNSANVIVEVPEDGDQTILDKIENDEESTFPYDASTEDELLAVLSTYGKARLTTDISIDDCTSGTIYYFESSTGEININLNDHTLFMNLADNYSVPENNSHTFRNGTLAIMDNKAYDPQYTYCSIAVGKGASLELNNVTYNSNWGGIMTAWDAATISIIDSRLFTYGYYGIGTNAGNQASGININIKGSKIEVGNTISELDIPMDSRIRNLHEDHDGTAVFFNVAGNLNIVDSTIIGGAQAVMIRGANTASITESTLIGGNASTSSTAFDQFRTGNWFDGNAAPYATVVIGNRNNDKYPSETNCTITDTEISVADDSSNPDKTPIYMASYSGHKANLTINDTNAKTLIISGKDYYGPNCFINSETEALPVDASGNPTDTE